MSRARLITTVAVVCLCLIAGCAGLGGSEDPAAGSTTPTQQPTSEATAAGPSSSGTDGPSGATVTPAAPNGTLEVHFINVGQSVSTLLVGPTGETMLIDTGDFTDDGEFVLQYLRQHDIDRIDYLIVSHNDADHIGGNADIIEYYETKAGGIGAIYDPGIAASTETYSEYLDAVEQYDVTLYETREGDTIPFEGVDVQVLGPPDPYLETEARNENSIVLDLTFGRTDMLFTGDAEDDQEQYLVDKYGDQLGAMVLKAGHHGSRSSTSGAVLDAVDPRAVVISSAYDSRYGHPHEETLQRLADRSIPTYWTATHGDVVFVSNGTAITVKTQRAAPTDPLALREGSPLKPGTTDAVRSRAVLLAGGGLQTPGSGDTVTATRTGTDESALAVVAINADAAGDDRNNLNDETITFENTGEETLDLSGWTISDEVGQSYTVPAGVTLPPGATVTLHTGSGQNTETDLYWGSGRPIWNNGGDVITVTASDGTQVLQEAYS